MKKRNFLHRVVGWVERELEASLAVLVILAAVVGYSLAATETTAPATDSGVTAQQVSLLSFNGKNYATIAFDSSLATDSSTVLVRKVKLNPDDPQDLATYSGKGLMGLSSGATYKASVALSGVYSGSLYVWGKLSSPVVLNGQTVVSSTTPVQVTGDTLTISFNGGDTSVAAISTLPKSTITKSQDVGSLFVIPSVLTLKVGETRNLVTLATTTGGQAVNPSITWKMTTVPSGIASIDPSTGAVTAKAAGTAQITAEANGKKASATITIVEEQKLPTISYPGADEDTKTSTQTQTETKTTTQEKSANTTEPTNSWNSDWGDQGFFSKVAELINPTADAATKDTTEKTVAAPSAAVVTEALFAPTAVVARVESTGKTNPTQQEVRAMTQTMTATQKFVTNLKIAQTQIASDLKAMIFGTTITNAKGEVVAKKPSAPKAIGQFILNLFGNGSNQGNNAGAAPQKGILEDPENLD